MIFLKMFVGFLMLLMFSLLMVSKNKVLDKIAGYIGIVVLFGVIIGTIGLVSWGLGTMVFDLLHGLGVLK